MSKQLKLKFKDEELPVWVNEVPFVSEVETFNATFDRFKLLADKKTDIFDEDIHALVSEEYVEESFDLFKLIGLKTSSESGKTLKKSLVQLI